MDIQYSMQLRFSWWEALPEVFVIHHAEDDAEPLNNDTSSQVRLHYVLCHLFHLAIIFETIIETSHIWEYM